MAARSFTVEIPEGVLAPHLRETMQRIVPELIIDQWRELAMEHADTGDYVAALHYDIAARYPYLGNPNAVSVVNVMPYADFLEHGRAGFHLPSRWTKWKTSKRGKQYAIVPFRIRTPIAGPRGPLHGTAERGGSTSTRRRQMMPPAVYKRAAALPDGGRLAGFGDQYKQSKSYFFFRQVFPDFPEHLRDPGYTWKASQFEGLTRRTARTPAGGHHTEYMTFRAITPNSNGWYIPPTPPLRFAERTMELLDPTIRQLLDEAAAADGMKALMDSTEDLI